MGTPLRTLPQDERWDCTRCGRCCRGSRISLDPKDLQRLREQRWEEHPDYRHVPIVVRGGWFGPPTLAQRGDGSCVFLTDAGTCRIHQDFGHEGKPLVCRMYPLQMVPLEDVVQLTVRRSCPAAAADLGRRVADYRAEVERCLRQRPELAEGGLPPTLQRGCFRSWPDTLLVTGALERLLTDQRYPLVRRIVHGLRFCEVFAACRLERLDSGQLRELVTILAAAAPAEVGDLFRQRPAPGRAAGALFRQTVLEYLRLHPHYTVRESWGARWRLARAAYTFARGQGAVPVLCAAFPATTFAALEQRELEPADLAVQPPLNAFFETHATSLQYAVLSRPGWSVVEKFRALALTFPVALWLHRYFAAEAGPTPALMIDIVTALERGQGFGPLTGRQHRRRVTQLAELQALEQLVAWYAR